MVVVRPECVSHKKEKKKVIVKVVCGCVLSMTGNWFGCLKKKTSFPPQLHTPCTDLQYKSKDNSGFCGPKSKGEAVKPLTGPTLRTIRVHWLFALMRVL